MTDGDRMGGIVIEPRSSWRHLGLTEVWRWRELLLFFIWRDLKVRYRQTAFGIAWAVLQPVLLMLVFTISVGQIPGIAPAGVVYAVFVLSGLVPWILFSQGVSGASGSLVGAEAVITKVYFPRLLLPISAMGSYLLDLCIATVLLVLVALASGAGVSWTIVWIPAMALLAIIAALGVGILLSAVNVRYRDVRHALPFLIQIWFFATPIAYAASLVPDQMRPLYALNPMVGAVEGFRWSVLGGTPPVDTLLVSAGVGVLLLLVALLYFRRVEQTFADVI